MSKVTMSTSEDLQTFRSVSLDFEKIEEITCSRNYSAISFFNNYRSKKNFVSADLCILDFDGEVSIQDAIRMFETYKAMILTTKSHQKGFKNGKEINKTDRFRVIIPFDKKITNVDEYENTMKNIVKDFDADPACVDGARFFYPNPIQATWQSKGENFLSIDKYNCKVNEEKAYKTKLKQKNIALNEDIQIWDRYGNGLYISEWLQVLKNHQTVTIHCPNPEHEDTHPSAFISLSKYSASELYIFCHKCGSLGLYPKKEFKFLEG